MSLCKTTCRTTAAWPPLHGFGKAHTHGGYATGQHLQQWYPRRWVPSGGAYDGQGRLRKQIPVDGYETSLLMSCASDPEHYPKLVQGGRKVLLGRFCIDRQEFTRLAHKSTMKPITMGHPWLSMDIHETANAYPRITHRYPCIIRGNPLDDPWISRTCRRISITPSWENDRTKLSLTTYHVLTTTYHLIRLNQLINFELIDH